MSSEFVHLHCHSEYSMLDGAARLKELVSRSARLAYPVRDGIPILLEEQARTLTDDELEQLPARTPLV